MRKVLALVTCIALSGYAIAAEPDTCTTDLVKISIKVPDGSDQVKLDACVKALFQKVKKDSHGRLLGMFRPGFEMIKWQSGSAWIYGHCYIHKGDTLFTLYTVSPIDNASATSNKACEAQNPVWMMLREVIARE